MHDGLYLAQAKWFRSFIVWWSPAGASWRIPVCPGGYLIGIVLLANLIAAHLKRFTMSWKKLGIQFAHFGIILLLVGQLTTDLFSRESRMPFGEGETRQYSESHMDNEIAFALDLGAEQERVVVIPDGLVRPGAEFRHPELPFVVRVKEHGANCTIRQRAPMMDTNPPPATEGTGRRATVIPEPETREMDKVNLPYAVLELIRSGTSLGTWLVSPWLDEQPVKIGDQTWRTSFRSERYYEPFSLTLLRATHEVYPGTDTPKNFQSRVEINHHATGEKRETDIYMNNPLRYGGLTFYQYQMPPDEKDRSRSKSVLMVVRNPSWLTPYVGCILVAVGLLWQFAFHLTGFVTRRLAA